MRLSVLKNAHVAGNAEDSREIAIALRDRSATLDSMRLPEMSQGAVGISNDLNTCPEVRWKPLIEEV